MKTWEIPKFMPDLPMCTHIDVCAEHYNNIFHSWKTELIRPKLAAPSLFCAMYHIFFLFMKY